MDQNVKSTKVKENKYGRFTTIYPFSEEEMTGKKAVKVSKKQWQDLNSDGE